MQTCILFCCLPSGMANRPVSSRFWKYSECSRKMSEADMKHIAYTFYDCDDGNKGYLSKEDVKVAIVQLLGYKPIKYEVEEMMEKACRQNPDVPGMSLDFFLSLMSSKMAVKDEDEEIRQTFLAFDCSCRGFITVADLKKIFSEVAPHMSHHAIESAFREVDRDGDGRVSYKDFEFMMKYNCDDGI